MLDATVALMLIILFTVLFECVAEYGWRQPRFSSVGVQRVAKNNKVTGSKVQRSYPAIASFSHGKSHYCVSYSILLVCMLVP